MINDEKVNHESFKELNYALKEANFRTRISVEQYDELKLEVCNFVH